MKIYTKKGDGGETSLIGGKRVPKNNIRVDAYGTVDELISALGTIRALEQEAYYKEFILLIQNKLMNIGAILASDGSTTKTLPEIADSDVERLENEIDRITETLPRLNSFIIPGGNLPESLAHLSRCICRRAERVCITLTDSETNVPPLLLKYLNRLSDFLFIYARKKDDDLNSKEISWQV
ncbi:MAG: cob(I)yrinic acid a,c-diamide adenosyltransferase [Prevotellaceae bacterium]|jgi:cob(I)alamin adenosyltransferase|nr:cob(I)yrinic acid a,c-diamide adenosyltransferase [Prevotellaceae bacterium]